MAQTAEAKKWSLAGKKAWATRRRNTLKRKKAALKAWVTMRKKAKRARR